MKKRSKVKSMEAARKKRGLTADTWRATGISVAFVPRPKGGGVKPFPKKK